MESNQQNGFNGQNESTEETRENNRQNPNGSTQSIASQLEGPQCPVCQNTIVNRALTDTCLHEFCFECLRESSLHNNSCPHCRTQYSNIIHDIQSNSQFQQTRVNDPDRNCMFITAVVIVGRIQGLQTRLHEERRRLTEDVRQMRNRSTENQKNGISLSETEQTALNTMERSLRAIEDTIPLLGDISDEMDRRILGIGYPIEEDSSFAEAYEDTDSIVASISQYRRQIPQTSSNSVDEQPADSRRSLDSAIFAEPSDSDSDNEDSDKNQTNGTPVTSDGRVSGQTETRQTTTDDNSNDQKDFDKR